MRVTLPARRAPPVGLVVKLLVPVKLLARPDGDVPLDSSGFLVPEGLEWQLNEWDLFSVEAAVTLAEADQESEVVLATIGEEHAEAGLLACLAMGADRAVRVWDPVLQDADALGVAAVLAALAAAEQPDLILCGVQSSDIAGAATGIALAGLLDVTHVAVVNAIERDGERLIVQRELDGGAVEVLALSMPALLTVQTGVNEPRRPTLREIKQARAKPLASLTITELGLDAGAVRAATGSRTVGLTERAREGGAQMLEGSAGEIAAGISEILKKDLRS